MARWARVHWTWALVGVTWVLLIAARLAGREDSLNHDELVGDGRLPSPGALVVFLLAWQVMTIAMMLPGSMPLVTLFRQANRANRGSRLLTFAFFVGYLLVWTGFAVLALAGDALIHRMVGTWPWLAVRPWLIGGTTLVIAGGFQFTSIKERCLAQCRSPLAFFVRHYRRGVGGAFGVGFGHGRFCLGCCWALMLLMFGLGVGSLSWMVNLAVVSYVERATAAGPRFSPIIGLTLVVWGCLVLLHPLGLPAIIASP